MTTPIGTGAISGLVSLRAVGLAAVLVAAVLAVAWLYQKNAGRRRKKPGQCLWYRAPVYNAATCRGLLGKNPAADIFAYGLEAAPSGGWYLHFTAHNPTGQPLDTLFLLQFEEDAPAVFSLAFVREAFGMREPIIKEELLDAFFAQKLAAVRAPRGGADKGETQDS